MTEIISETVRFEAKDGWPLVGDVIRGETPSVAILISAGTGFPRRFYRHIAAYFATRGAVVLIYDFRGIGDSVGGNSDFSDVGYTEWGRLDMVAALEVLEQAAPGLPLVQLGHSVGGQFVGFMENHAKVARQAFLSVGSGFWGVHHKLRIPMELFFWWGYGSYALARWGMIPKGKLWTGEAIPPGVFRQWRRWSARRSYFGPDLAARVWPNHFDELKTPICAWVFEDDGIATPKAAVDTLSCYSRAEKHLVVRNPQQLGVKRIGHEGAFLRGREALWAECWAWLADAELPDEAGKV